MVMDRNTVVAMKLTYCRYFKHWTYETDDGTLVFANYGDVLDISLDCEPIIPESLNVLIAKDKYRLVGYF